MSVAGLLLFGKPSALRRELPMMRVDYMRVNGREWLADPERPYDDLIEHREPFLLMIPRIVAQIEEDIPKTFSLPPDSLQGKDTPLIPRRVRSCAVCYLETLQMAGVSINRVGGDFEAQSKICARAFCESDGQRK